MIQAGLHPTAEQVGANIRAIETNQQNIAAPKRRLGAAAARLHGKFVRSRNEFPLQTIDFQPIRRRAVMCAQSNLHTYSGMIVNARCQQAAKIVNSNSRGYSPSKGVNAFTERKYKPTQSPSNRKNILQHCGMNPRSTEFALLDAEGNFHLLDENGNREVLAQTPITIKSIEVVITGLSITKCFG